MPPQIPYTGGTFAKGGMVLPQFRDWVNQNYQRATQSPGDAFRAQLVRQYVPGGPWMQDLPQSGFQSFRANPILSLFSRMPWVGGAARAGQAYGRAQQATEEGWMVQPPNEGGFDRALAGASSIMQYVPGGLGGGAVGMAKNALGLMRGFREMPGYSSSWAESGSELGGEMGGRMIPSSSPNSGWSPAMNGSSFMSPSWQDTIFAGADNFALQRSSDYDYAQERMG